MRGNEGHPARSKLWELRGVPFHVWRYLLELPVNAAPLCALNHAAPLKLL